MPHFIVQDIEFDFGDDYCDDDGRYKLTSDDEIALRDNALGVWHVDDESELVDKISDVTGWCIKSIDYVPNQPHPLPAYM